MLWGKDFTATPAQNPVSLNPCKKKKKSSVLSLCISDVFIFCRTTYLHQVYFADNSVVTIVSNSPVHLLRSLITVGWGKHISSHAAQKTKSHRHFLQTDNYSFPKHRFWMHHGWNNVREPLYSYRCSFDCLETFSTASAMCTYMLLMFFGFGFWLQRHKRYQTLLFTGTVFFYFIFSKVSVLTLKAKQLFHCEKRWKDEKD